MVQQLQLDGGMPLREFTDPDGSAWRVWDTVPARTEGLGSDFRAGWLTFDNGAERRRLAPLPEAWATMPDDRLVLLLRVAHPIGTRDQPPPEMAGERRVGDRRKSERRHENRRRGLPPPS